MFVSEYLFFNSSRSLLIDSCIFSIMFSRFLIIFAVIILNYFSGNFPISSSFIWTSVFLVCSFVCAVFICLFIFFFLSYCVWGLLSPGFKESWILFLKKVEFFLLVSALLSLVQWFVWVSCRVKFVLSFCSFAFPLMGKAEWGGILYADDWVCIFVLFVV